MVRRILVALSAIASLACQPLAHGMASAQVDITSSSFGPLEINLSTPGDQFAFQGPFPIQLAPGEVIDTVFNYTVAITEDGLPVPPPTGGSVCVPLFVGPCTPTYTGFEQVLVEFVVGYRDGRGANPFISIAGHHFVHQTPSDGTPESFTESGSFHLQIVNTTALSQEDLLGFLNYAAAFVQAVPEPETYGLMLLGLGMIGIASRRTRIARSNS